MVKMASTLLIHVSLVMLRFIYITAKATSPPDGFIRESNLIITLSSDKDQRKNLLSLQYN